MRLRIISLDGTGNEIIVADPAARLGKDPACEVQFDARVYPMVSGEHARIERDGRGARLLHLSRNNKTLLNDRPVDGAAPIKKGDRIRLGFSGPILEVISVELPPRDEVTAVRRGAQAVNPEAPEESPEVLAEALLLARSRRLRWLYAGAAAGVLIIGLIVFFISHHG